MVKKTGRDLSLPEMFNLEG